jgi:hypothetical protein
MVAVHPRGSSNDAVTVARARVPMRPREDRALSVWARMGIR